jgi:hypothetical protein
MQVATEEGCSGRERGEGTQIAVGHPLPESRYTKRSEGQVPQSHGPTVMPLGGEREAWLYFG